MYTSRRSFLKTGAMAVAGAALLPDSLFAATESKLKRVGVQLYSVRDAMKADPQGTLKKIADAGYAHVEHANYIDRKFYGYTAKEFKKILADLDLKMPSGHTVMTPQHWDASKNDFTDAWKYTVEDAATMGQKFVISPWLDEKVRTDTDALKRAMEQFNKCGELCKQSSMMFGYHNHNFEISTKVGDITLYDYIIQNTDPALVAQQIDIGNMFSTGGKALEFINKYPGRFQSMHVKDEIKVPPHNGDDTESTILGAGILPVRDIVKAGAKKGGTSLFIIEQEAYQGKDPIDCVKIDLQIMKKWGY
jgi:sugar phosphate isomerase/epimerase